MEQNEFEELTWQQFGQLISQLTREIRTNYQPDSLLALARGG